MYEFQTNFKVYYKNINVAMQGLTVRILRATALECFRFCGVVTEGLLTKMFVRSSHGLQQGNTS
jgi:hypothetical protein